jgi:3-hydroxyisobutyrate dehydrogenase-like beta-hydroxyacid dehydrogenase
MDGDTLGPAVAACAVIGTGDMGLALASALLAAGHRVTVWNRSEQRYASLIEEGAHAAGSVAAAIDRADLVVVCLHDYPVTRQVLAAAGVSEAIAGRTLLQYSFSSGEEAAALESWVKQRGGDYLHGQIKAYPREIGTPAARLNHSGSEAIFHMSRATIEVFGEPFYLGPDVHAACVVSSTSTVLYGCFVAAFFEVAAYAAADGAELESVVAMLPSASRLAEQTIEHSARQLATGQLTGDQASIDTQAGALATCVRAMARKGRREPRLARAALDYLEEARSTGLGSLEIAAIYGMLMDSLERPSRRNWLPPDVRL